MWTTQKSEQSQTTMIGFYISTVFPRRMWKHPEKAIDMQMAVLFSTTDQLRWEGTTMAEQKIQWQCPQKDWLDWKKVKKWKWSDLPLQERSLGRWTTKATDCFIFCFAKPRKPVLHFYTFSSSVGALDGFVIQDDGKLDLSKEACQFFPHLLIFNGN